MKKSRRKSLENKLDRLFSQYIRQRDGNICFTCGASGDDTVVQAGHLITRGRRVVRYDPRNGQCQCRTCNLIHEHRPEIFTKKYILKYGAKAYDKLVSDSWEDKKFTLSELEALVDKFEKLLAGMK